jgi:hypothetical protein
MEQVTILRRPLCSNFSASAKKQKSLLSKGELHRDQQNDQQVSLGGAGEDAS